MKTSFSKDYLIKNSGCYINKPIELNTILDTLFPPERTLNDLIELLPLKDFIWFMIYHTELEAKDRISHSVYLADLALVMYPTRNTKIDEYNEDKVKYELLSKSGLYHSIITRAIAVINSIDCDTEEFRNKVKELI